jgi:ribosomal-protein-alanine N-acetyltransferase
MSKTEILTDNLKLLLQTTEQVLASIDAMSPADRAEVSPEWLARMQASSSSDPWLHGFAVTHRESGVIIGSCGFRAPPGPEAFVEIAYGIDPAYQGRGYATEAARALVAFAFGSGKVSLVRAHTKPTESASTRVLTKCRFVRVGDVVDPEDGLVWRWELRPTNKEL